MRYKTAASYMSIVVTIGCGGAVKSLSEPNGGSGVAIQNSALHSLITPIPQPCITQSIAHVPALLAALPTPLTPAGYGNWCGPHTSGPGDPISCWDAACRVHDYAYGRWQDGFVSCHSVVENFTVADSS